MRFQRSLRGNGSVRAFTLIEMMISLVITLGMVYAMVEVFARIGKQTTESRAVIEMLGQIRSARYRLEQDLKGITVPVRPWVDADATPGYFELIEGVGRDNLAYMNDPDGPHQRYYRRQIDTTVTPNLEVRGEHSRRFDTSVPATTAAVAKNAASLMGDVDDIIAFTARSNGEPFRGRYNGTIIESNLAEIVWWTELNDTNGNGELDYDRNESFRVHRRVLLIRPDLNNSNGFCHIDTRNQAKPEFLQVNDLSVRNHRYTNGGTTTVGLAANSLGDLSYHHNRAGRYTATLTNGLLGNARMSPFDIAYLPAYPANPVTDPVTSQPAERFGEDVILTNVLAFDFRVYDPFAPVMYDSATPSEVLTPGDAGFTAVLAASLPANGARFGAFVDLGELVSTDVARWYTGSSAPSPSTPYTNDAPNALTKANNAGSYFLGIRDAKSHIDPVNNRFARVYDTWPLQYEKDGNDQDLPFGDTLGADQGTNGLDDDGANGVDDPNERETSPPYAHPLRGLQVRIRMLEADTRQVRQSSFSLSFVQD